MGNKIAIAIVVIFVLGFAERLFIKRLEHNIRAEGAGVQEWLENIEIDFSEKFSPFTHPQYCEKTNLYLIYNYKKCLGIHDGGDRALIEIKPIRPLISITRLFASESRRINEGWGVPITKSLGLLLSDGRWYIRPPSNERNNARYPLVDDDPIQEKYNTRYMSKGEIKWD